MTLSSTPGPAKNRRLLHRGNVRDTVLVLALVSAAGFPLPFGNFWCAFGILAAGSLLNFMTKGILIRNTVLCDRGV